MPLPATQSSPQPYERPRLRQAFCRGPEPPVSPKDNGGTMAPHAPHHAPFSHRFKEVRREASPSLPRNSASAVSDARSFFSCNTDLVLTYIASNGVPTLGWHQCARPVTTRLVQRLQRRRGVVPQVVRALVPGRVSHVSVGGSLINLHIPIGRMDLLPAATTRAVTVATISTVRVMVHVKHQLVA